MSNSDVATTWRMDSRVVFQGTGVGKHCGLSGRSRSERAKGNVSKCEGGKEIAENAVKSRFGVSHGDQGGGRPRAVGPGEVAGQGNHVPVVGGGPGLGVVHQHL